MMRWLAGVSVLATVLWGGVAVSYGQIIPQLEVNLFGSANARTKNNYEIGFPQSATPIPAEVRFDDAIGGGVRFNVYTSGHFGQEFFYSFEPNEVRFISSAAPNRPLDLEVQIHNIGVNGLFYLNSDETAATRPFLSFGLGATIYRPTPESRAFARDPLRGNTPAFDQSNEFAFNYGVGFKRRIAGITGVRMDVRHFLGRQPSFSLARSSSDPTAAVLPATGAIHTVEASVGIVFYFRR